MADIMTSIGLDINDFKGAVNQLQESTAKLKTGVQGNMLAMAAGILGVGATVYTFAKQSAEDFDNLISRSKKLSEEFKNLASDAGFATLNSTMSKTVALSEELAVQEAKSAAARDNILKGYAAGISALSKGKGLGDIELETQMEISRLYWQKVKLMQDVTAQSDLDVKMSELKLKGADDEIDALKRKAKLEKEIADIIASSFDAKTKATLIQNAEQIANNDEQLKANEKVAKQDEFNRKQKEDFLKFEADEEKKKKDEADKLRKSLDDMLDEMEADENKIYKRRRDNAKKLAEDQKKLREDAGKMLDEWNDEEIEARNKRIEKNKANKQSLADAIKETQIMNVQARGTSLQAKLKISELETEQKITQAKKDGNFELVKQLEIQRGINDMQAKIDERLKTPEQKKAERTERRKRDAAERAVKRREEAIAQGRAVLKKEENGIGLGIGNIMPRPMMQPQAAQPAAAAIGGAAGNVMTVETLNVKVLKSQ